MVRSKGGNTGRLGAAQLPFQSSERELIVLARSTVGLRATPMGVVSAAGVNIASLMQLLSNVGAKLVPLFGAQEDVLARLSSQFSHLAQRDTPCLEYYYRVIADDDRLDDLAEKLSSADEIEAVYIKPPAYPPRWFVDALPVSDEPATTTPDFTSGQGYLDLAPEGIDARFAWTLAGGRGAGVRIVDIEGAWQFSHEDLLQNQGGVVGGSPSTDPAWRNHGTAVVGEFGGDQNNFGTTGICPEANVSAVSIFGTSMGSARAIRLAADRLRAGDILLIELHRPGPRFNFQSRQDQRGYIPIEWWPDDYEAIRYAVLRGVIVVEAAGNGAESLDDPLYDVRPTGFPLSWTNPFRRRPERDSGAVLVGAGAPPPGTHGQNHGPDRSRLDFSNYGALIDAQGWGREVTTTGYGDLQGGSVEDRWYTDAFAGTSSASPIVVGALACLQGVLRAHDLPLLTPTTARVHLRGTGSPQQGARGRPATQRIGNRPNLRQLLAEVGGLDAASEAAAGGQPHVAGMATINIHRVTITINVR